MTSDTRPYFRVVLLSALLLSALSPHIASAAGEGDVSDGSDVYDSECADCHSARQGKNKKGPSLFAVVGRHSGTQQGYQYSEAMAHSAIVWTPEKIQAYLAAPKTVVPGGKMKYDSGDLSAQDIADLLAFLKTLH